MADFDRNTILPIPCPNPECGYEFKVRVRRLEQDPILTCAGCGSEVKFDGRELRDILREIDNLPGEITINFE